MNLINNKPNGTLAEFQVITKLLTRGFIVSIPQGGYAGYDLIAGNQKGGLFKIQVKSTKRQLPISKGYRVNMARGGGKRHYTANECDFLIFVVCSQYYVIPLAEINTFAVTVYPNGHKTTNRTPNFLGRWEQYKNNWSIIC